MLTILLLFVGSLFATTTHHTIQLPNGPFSYTATVGSIDEIGYIAYKKGGEYSDRPITFAFNGGPGSSSVWLHLGALGPKRIVSPEEGQSPTPPYQLVDNFETLLDLSDLVFIDPAGTGLSQIEEENEGDYYSVQKDIDSIAEFVRDYLTENKGWNAPKYIVGESYGAFRASGLANRLQSEYGIYLNGLVLISCALDYQTLCFDKDNILPYFLTLPTYATTAWYHGRFMPGTTVEDAANMARLFVYKAYIPTLLRRNYHEKDLIYSELAEITGLPVSLIQKTQGRIDNGVFLHEFFSDENKILGGYDTRVSGYYSNPFMAVYSQDPSVTSVEGIFSGAFHDYLQRDLDVPLSYRLVSLDVNRKWDYKQFNTLGYPNMMEDLRSAIAINPSLKIFVGSGYFDAVTPFAATEYCFDHLEMPHASVQMEYYEGGHMYYLNPFARKKFKQDLVRFYEN